MSMALFRIVRFDPIASIGRPTHVSKSVVIKTCYDRDER